jgi:Leucine-rich repeat (LRR) protein
MQSFGLIGLLIVVGVAGWWLYSAGPAGVSESTHGTTTYQDSINAAQEAVDLIEGRDVPVSSQAVFVADGVSVPVDTRVLDLSGRGLSGSLKAEIRQLKSLEILDISNNNFTGLPAEIGQLSQLRVLNVSNNPLTGLPYELGNLQNLKQFDLIGTSYAEADLEIIRASLPSETVIFTD